MLIYYTMPNLEEIKKAVVSGAFDQIKELVKKAVDSGQAAKKILDEGLIAGMQKVGESFKKNEMFIPEVMISAKTMQLGLNIIEPLLVGLECRSRGRIVIGTVKGDLHDIGKNLVAMMLKGAGFEIFDLGIDVAPEKFLKKAAQTQSKMVAMSSLITTSLPSMGLTISLFKKNKLPVKIMVGGAPVTQEFATEIGADGYAPDAVQAVELALTLYEN